MAEYLLSVSILIVAVLLIRGIFRKTVSPRVIYALWLVVVIRMILPVSLFEVSITVPKFLHTEQNTQNQQTEQIQTPPSEIGGIDDGFEELPPPTIPITPIIPDGNTEPSIPTETPVTPTIPNEPEPVIPSEPVTSPEKSVSLTPIQIINIVWLAGVVIAEGVIIFTAVSYEERLRKSRKFYKNIGRTKVYISESADVPCVAGFIPSIYITPECINSDSENLIVIHEHCHIRHGDHIWSYIRVASLVVFWWNPLVWIAAMISKHDAELACDDAVSLALTDSERIRYANVLIDTIPQKRKYAVGLGSAPMKERIIMLSKKQKNSLICIVLTIILALSAVGCSFTSFNEKETTSTEPETIPPSTDTEAPETDTETEPDTETENTDGEEIESYVAASGDGYVFAQPGGKLTISSDAGFEFVKNFHDKAWKKETKWYIGELTIEGSVTAIPDEMFSSMGALDKVFIGEGVTNIGDKAFADCWSLKRVLIPDSVTSIGAGAFYKCKELHNVQLSDNVTELGSGAFNGCKLLKNVRLPNNITEIKDSMFGGCESLLLVDIPKNVTSIGNVAFSGCSLRQVILPDGVVSIGDGAFAGNEFRSIEIPDSIVNIGKSAFSGCTLLESVKLPENLTEVNDSVFYGCEKLSAVEIPDSVTTIADRAFYKCTSLANVIMGDNVKTIATEAFFGCTKLMSIQFGKSLKKIYSSAFSGCTSLESIELPYGVQSLEHECFADCTSLKSIKLPNSITEVGRRIFKGCLGPAYIEIPKNMTVLEYEKRLSVITNLKSAVIKDGATRIGRHCFEGCANLETVEIPNSVKYIDDLAFHQCTSLKEIRFKGTEAEWNAIVKDDILWDFEAGDYTITFEK